MGAGARKVGWAQAYLESHVALVALERSLLSVLGPKVAHEHSQRRVLVQAHRADGGKALVLHTRPFTTDVALKFVVLVAVLLDLLECVEALMALQASKLTVLCTGAFQEAIEQILLRRPEQRRHRRHCRRRFGHDCGRCVVAVIVAAVLFL